MMQLVSNAIKTTTLMGAVTTALGLFGCKVRGPGSDLSVGRAIDIRETDLPSVRQFQLYNGNKKVGECTANFIYRNIMLTAGHCVLGPQWDNLKVLGKHYPKEKLVVIGGERFQMDGPGLCSRFDMKIIGFLEEDDVSPDFSMISYVPLVDNEPISLVGYGSIQATHSVHGDNGQKRLGNNRFHDEEQHWRGIITSYGTPGHPGKYMGRKVPIKNLVQMELDSVTGPGDSGGPLLNKSNEQVGINSFGFPGVSQDVDGYVRLDVTDNLNDLSVLFGAAYKWSEEKGFEPPAAVCCVCDDYKFLLPWTNDQSACQAIPEIFKIALAENGPQLCDAEELSLCKAQLTAFPRSRHILNASPNDEFNLELAKCNGDVLLSEVIRSLNIPNAGREDSTENRAFMEFLTLATLLNITGRSAESSQGWSLLFDQGKERNIADSNLTLWLDILVNMLTSNVASSLDPRGALVELSKFKPWSTEITLVAAEAYWSIGQFNEGEKILTALNDSELDPSELTKKYQLLSRIAYSKRPLDSEKANELFRHYREHSSQILPELFKLDTL